MPDLSSSTIDYGDLDSITKNLTIKVNLFINLN